MKKYQKVRMTSNRYRCNGITEGMIGYILEIYDERSCEVEFSDADSGATVACQAIDKACFEVIDD